MQRSLKNHIGLQNGIDLQSSFNASPRRALLVGLTYTFFAEVQECGSNEPASLNRRVAYGKDCNVVVLFQCEDTGKYYYFAENAFPISFPFCPAGYKIWLSTHYKM